MVVLIPNKLTHKFQPLDLTVNKPAKKFLSNKWYVNEVKVQLPGGITPEDVKVSCNYLISRDFTQIGLWNVTNI